MRQIRKKEGILQSSENDGIRHESLNKFVTGKAQYIDDLSEENGTLHAYIGKSDFAKGKILDLDLEEVRTAEGVVDIFSARDLPGLNDISPTGLKDEPVLADKEVSYYGQPLFVVVAKTRLQARKAASFAKLKKSINSPLLDIQNIKEKNPEIVTPPLKLERGDVDKSLKKSRYRLNGALNIGGQDHFYLEGHIAMAKLEDSAEVIVLSSTQHPTEVQHMVAKVLNIPFNKVIVKVKRMGGGFGGKETQSNFFAAIAALAAVRTGKAVKFRPDRDDDMIITGKRHPFYITYNVGFEHNGEIMAVDALLSANCGFSSDLSGPITDRALFHSDNCYYYPNVRLISRPLKTNKVSNTAFRGFGGPQMYFAIERVMHQVAVDLGLDARLAVRRDGVVDRAGVLGRRHLRGAHHHAIVLPAVVRARGEAEGVGDEREHGNTSSAREEEVSGGCGRGIDAVRAGRGAEIRLTSAIEGDNADGRAER